MYIACIWVLFLLLKMSCGGWLAVDAACNTDTADTPAGAGEGERTVQGLLLTLHRMPPCQDAE